MIMQVKHVFSIAVGGFLLALLCSCKKDPKLASSIQVGIEEDMEVVYHHNTVLSSNLQQNDKSYLIDMDADGNPDLRIRHRTSYSIVFGLTSELSFNSTHTKFQLLTYGAIDSTFANFGIQNTTHQSGNPITIYAQNYSCSKENEQAIFVETNPVRRLSSLAKSQTVSTEDEFTATNCYVLKMDSASINPTNDFIGNSQIYEQFRYRNSCTYFPTEQFVYIAFRLSDATGESRLGWIRLKIESDGNAVIDRHAIQKVIK